MLLYQSFQFDLTQHTSPTTRPFTSTPLTATPYIYRILTITFWEVNTRVSNFWDTVIQFFWSPVHHSHQLLGVLHQIRGRKQWNSGTESVVDIEGDFKFPVCRELQKCDSEDRYPEDNVLTRFIRDCAACLQAVAGDDISPTNLVLAATKMCDTVNVLKYQKPASFPSNRQFPYWLIG